MARWLHTGGAGAAGAAGTSGGGGSGTAFVSVMDHGAIGDGVADDTAAINTTITFAHALAAGGGRIYFPPGKYKITAGGIVIPASPAFSNLTFFGDGDVTIIQVSGTLTAGVGACDIKASNLMFEDFVLDGGVITSAEFDWSTITDPMQASLTTGSAFWIHGGCRNIRFSRVTIRHTGGYAILLDATSTGDIDGVTIDSCLFENNRPHTFGTGGVNTYQSWTGGIHYQGDGTTYCVKNVSIHDCTFRRSPGSQIWGHLYAFTRMHKNIWVDRCSFVDIGLEGCEHGGLDGGGVTNCHFHRTGFVTGNSDLTAAVPAWLANHQSTAIDTAGLCTNLVYANNTLLNCNGGYIDMDGFGQGTVTGNSCVCSQPGEPEYTEDQVASFGPAGAGAQYVYGINCDNTSGQNLGGASNTITGNFFSKIGAGPIRLYGSRNCKISGNNINHLASGFLSPPISLGPVAAGANYRATGNVITDNVINWNPGTMQPAVFEDPVITAFVGTDKNWVAGNQIAIGSNVYEFAKDANSGSVSRIVLSSMVSGLTASSETWQQREGTLAAPLTRWYKNLSGTAVAIMTLQDAGTYATAPVTPGPLLNVTSGAGLGGVITTGSRTTAAFDDAVVTGKLYADSFLSLTDTTYLDTDADILLSVTTGFANVGMIRYKKLVGHFEQSVTIASGHRVWTSLAGAVSGADTQVQFNKAGVFGADSTFWFDYTNLVLQVPALTSAGRILTNNSYVMGAQSPAPALPAKGFAKFYFDDALGWPMISVFPNSASSATVYSPFARPAGSNQQVQFNASGFFGADSHLFFDYTNFILSSQNLTALTNVLSSYYSLNGLSVAPSSSAGTARWFYDSVAHVVKLSVEGGAYAVWGQPGGSNECVQFNDVGGFGGTTDFIYDKAAKAVTINALNASSFGLNVGVGYIQSAVGYYSGGSADTTLNLPTGGAFARRHIASFDFVHVGVPTVAAPTGTGGQGKLYYDVTINRWMVLEGTNAAVPITTSSVAGTSGQIQYNSGVSTFAASAGLVWDNSANQLLTTVNITATGRILANGSFSLAAAAAPSVSAGGFSKWYYDSTAHVTKISFEGGTYIPFGVTGGNNQNVQFRDSDASFAGSGNFIYDKATQAVTIAALNSSSFGLNVTVGYIQSAVGYQSTGAADTTVNVPNGGVFGRRHIASFDIVHTGVPTVAAPIGAAGQGKLYYDVTINRWMVLEGTNAAVPITTSSVAGTSGQIQYNSGVSTFAASAGLVWDNTANQLLTTVNITATGRILANGSYSLAATATPTTASAGFMKWYYDSTSHIPRISTETNAYIAWGLPGGSNQYVQFRDSDGSFNGTADFIFDKTNKAVTINALNSGSFGLNVTTGYVQSAVGFASSGGADTTVNIPSGGVFGRRHIASFDIVHTGVPTVAAPTGTGGQGKLYYDNTTNLWMVIQGASSAAPMLAGVVAGTGGQVQFNSGVGTFAASSGLAWDNTANQLLTTVNITASGRILANGAYIAAAITAPSLPSFGFAKWYFDSSANLVKISYNGAAYAVWGAPIGGADTQVQFNSAGAFAGTSNLTWVSGSSIFTVGGTIQATIAMNCLGSSDSAIQCATGGVSAKRFISTYDIVGVGVSSSLTALPPPAAGQGKLYFDTSPGTGNGKWMVTQGVSPAVPMISAGGGTPGGADTQIQYNGPQFTGGSFSGSANYTWNNSLQRMTVFGISNTAGIVCGTGFIQSDGGYLVTATNTAYNTIQSSGGIVSLKSIQVGPNYTFDQAAGAAGILVHAMGTNQIAGVFIDSYDTTGLSGAIPVLISRRARGTPGPSAFLNPVQTNDVLFSFGARGSYGAVGFSNASSAAINMMATEPWNSGAQGAEIQFATVRNGTLTRTTGLIVRNTGTTEIMQGFYAHFGIQADGAFYPLSQGGTPPAPSAGYAGWTHQSGTTWWYYVPGTGWATVNLAGGGGGGVTSLNTMTGAVSIVNGGGLTLSPNVPTLGQMTMTVSSSVIPYLGGSNVFSGVNTFNSTVNFNSNVSLSIWNFQSGGLFTGLTKLLTGTGTSLSAGIYCGPGVLSQFGILGSGHNVYLQNNFNGTWQVAAGGGTASASKQITLLTSTLPTFITLYFIGGVLVGDSNTIGIYYNNFAVTAPY